MTTATPVYISIDGVYYSLTHAPDLVRYGSKPSREIAASGARLGEINKQLRKFTDAVCYAPHQVFIGAITPQQLADLPTPWYGKLIEGARAQGKFGDIVSQDRLYALLAAADDFKLVTLEDQWFQEVGAKYANGATVQAKTLAEIKALCEKTAIPLYAGERLVGAFDTDFAEDANLAPDVLLENLAAKATAAHSLRGLLDSLNMKPSAVDYVISCSEEAIGDRYNRGGGNLAKAIAEKVGCENASGSDTKAFCAGPMYAMVHGASLIQSGVVRNVAVVAGGSLAKLGMKFESHVKGNMPILEDMLGSFAVMLSAAKKDAPSIRLDSAAFHPVRAGGSPQAMAEFLAEKPLAKLGMKFTDVDRYAVELHNPEITVPSGSGDVPRTNYRTLAALAVMRGHIKKEQMEDFARTRGMVGYAPTQGHIPSAVSYLGHALDALRAGEIRNTLFIAKGSLFLGRMTQLSDGCSFLVERNQG
ncbi:MAG: glycine reductase [Deltaproteobacteria bacterium]|nr:glycine reductase [Deltaproteobacteria bacterium]